MAEPKNPSQQASEQEGSAQQASVHQPSDALYCPNCARPVADPLTCGDCSAVICRVCGTPLESSSDLGMG